MRRWLTLIQLLLGFLVLADAPIANALCNRRAVITAHKTREWKQYGPDINCVYGGANGTGGFEAVSPYLSLFEPVISDIRGNVLAVITNSVVSWTPARPTGYGAVPGYRPVALGSGASLSLSSAWRGRWADITGYHSVGARTYDPVSGRWLSFDPACNGVDLNGFSAFGGDPINLFDSDGRMSRADYQLQTARDEFDTYFNSGNASITGFYSHSIALQNLLANYFPGQAMDSSRATFSMRMLAIDLLFGGSSQADPSFLDATANASYYNQMSANGLNRGGVSGYAEAAVGQVGEDLLDLFGTTSVQQSSQQSGYASADPSRQGAAWGWGAVTVGSIAMNAIPGGGKAANLVEEEGVKALTASVAKEATQVGGTDFKVSYGSTGNRFLDSIGLQSAQISDIRMSVDASLPANEFLEVSAHEGFHVNVAQNYPNFAAAGMLQSGRSPVFNYLSGFPLYFGN